MASKRVYTHVKVPASKHSELMLLTVKENSLGLTVSKGYKTDWLASWMILLLIRALMLEQICAIKEDKHVFL